MNTRKNVRKRIISGKYLASRKSESYRSRPMKSKKRKTSPIILRTPDGEKIRFIRPRECEYLRAIARGYNKKHGTRLPADRAIVRVLTEVLDHPVKSLKYGSLEKQDQLAPSDLLPAPVQFANSSPV
jgi:hypothetical protein